MENIRDLLNLNLLSQSFTENKHDTFSVEKAREIAKIYTGIEGGISVLSDMKSKKSYVRYGASANKLGLAEKEVTIESIWEDELLNLLHPEDLKKKYRLELHFFRLLKAMDIQERTGFEAISKLRARGAEGKEEVLKHRIIYIGSLENGDIWLALCLYNILIAHPGFDAPDAVILNTITGNIINHTQGQDAEVLSEREQQIIRLIKSGNRSKDIATKLSISIHTVNRHRQNIFEKLNATNAMEACKIAEAAGII